MKLKLIFKRKFNFQHVCIVVNLKSFLNTFGLNLKKLSFQVLKKQGCYFNKDQLS